MKKGLESLDRSRVKFQVSIDGARPETNDPIRGAGTFVKALDGAKLLADLGFDVSLTTVTTEENLSELVEIPALVKRVGAKSQHLMWSHRRGRAVESGNGFFPENVPLLKAVLAVADAAAPRGNDARQPRGDQAARERRPGRQVRPRKRRLGLDLRLRGRQGLPDRGPRERARARLRRRHAAGSSRGPRDVADRPDACGPPRSPRSRRSNGDPFRFFTGGGRSRARVVLLRRRLPRRRSLLPDLRRAHEEGHDRPRPREERTEERALRIRRAARPPCDGRRRDRLRHRGRSARRGAGADASLQLRPLVRRRQAAREGARVLRRRGRDAAGRAVLPDEVRRRGGLPHPART